MTVKIYSWATGTNVFQAATPYLGPSEANRGKELYEPSFPPVSSECSDRSVKSVSEAFPARARRRP